jgi:hypothetical protein
MKTTYEWTLLFLSLGIIVQTLEYLSLKNLFSEKGIWRWSELRSEYAFLPYFDFFLAEKAFVVLLWIRLIAAFFMLFSFSFPLMLILFLTTLLITLRFRGSFNGGSDYLTTIVLSALCVGAFFGTEQVLKGVLMYIAFQSVLSYFLAGLVKIKQPLWRNGKALIVFIHSPNYRPPEFFKTMLENKNIAFIAAWFVMIAELLFPLVLILPTERALFMIVGAFLFHLNNVLLFGLNRFLLAWLATYPAIYFVANSFSNSP